MRSAPLLRCPISLQSLAGKGPGVQGLRSIPVQRHERRRSGRSAAHPEQPSVPGRRRMRSAEVGGIQAQDGGGSNGGGMAGRSRSQRSSLPFHLEVVSLHTPHGVYTSEENVNTQGTYVMALRRRAWPSQALRSSMVPAVSEPAGRRKTSSGRLQ
ncbi:Hypothetical predicted protein [Pelobates cultripes]|uniref:Uncharacterized protein n=1 Tax=Pelobates cultripes TaxID=61616 RepID=A0AAD1T197_PELCU|nr:Hypothetical predicted protein [Pelobates cultripes]